MAEAPESREQFLHEALQLANDPNVAPIDYIAPLHFIGFGLEAKKLARLAVDRQETSGVVEPWLELLAGDITPRAVIGRAPDTTRRRKAHWMSVHWYFGNHDRNKAKHHLELGAKAGDLSAANILKRMEDPEWPRWLKPPTVR